MDEGSFDRVAYTLRAFHQYFAPLFGRPEARQRSAQYLRGLLVQQTDRRNAENLAEAVEGATPRALQRFLSDSPWAHQPVLDALQRYLGERLLPRTPAEGRVTDGVWLVDDTGFAKQGTHSVGVARQYSGTLGKVGNCQLGVFLGYATARGHTLVDSRLYLPRAWLDDPARCRAAGVPDDVLAAGYQSKAALALAQLRHARAVGALVGQWVTADRPGGTRLRRGAHLPRRAGRRRLLVCRRGPLHHPRLPPARADAAGAPGARDRPTSGDDRAGRAGGTGRGGRLARPDVAAAHGGRRGPGPPHL